MSKTKIIFFLILDAWDGNTKILLKNEEIQHILLELYKCINTVYRCVYTD